MMNIRILPLRFRFFVFVILFSDKTASHCLDSTRLPEKESRLIVSSFQALLRLCLGASGDLARCEALFNMADAKVPRIQ